MLCRALSVRTRALILSASSFHGFASCNSSTVVLRDGLSVLRLSSVPSWMPVPALSADMTVFN